MARYTIEITRSQLASPAHIEAGALFVPAKGDGYGPPVMAKIWNSGSTEKPDEYRLLQLDNLRYWPHGTSDPGTAEQLADLLNTYDYRPLAEGESVVLRPS